MRKVVLCASARRSISICSSEPCTRLSVRLHTQGEFPPTEVAITLMPPRRNTGAYQVSNISGCPRASRMAYSNIKWLCTSTKREPSCSRLACGLSSILVISTPARIPFNQTTGKLYLCRHHFFFINSIEHSPYGNSGDMIEVVIDTGELRVDTGAEYSVFGTNNAYLSGHLYTGLMTRLGYTGGDHIVRRQDCICRSVVLQKAGKGRFRGFGNPSIS